MRISSRSCKSLALGILLLAACACVPFAAAQADPADPRGYLLLGKLLRHQGQRDEARAVYQRGAAACRNAGNETGAQELEAQLGR